MHFLASSNARINAIVVMSSCTVGVAGPLSALSILVCDGSGRRRFTDASERVRTEIQTGRDIIANCNPLIPNS